MLLRRSGWNSANTNPSTYRMGAYKYIGELYKKKQSDVLRFLLRVRCVAVQTCCLIYSDCRYEIVAGSTDS